MGGLEFNNSKLKNTDNMNNLSHGTIVLVIKRYKQYYESKQKGYSDTYEEEEEGSFVA